MVPAALPEDLPEREDIVRLAAAFPLYVPELYELRREPVMREARKTPKIGSGHRSPPSTGAAP